MMTESQRAALAEYAAVKCQCPARERLAALFDDGVYTETGSNLRAGENLAGVVTAYGYIGGTPAYAFSQDMSRESYRSRNIMVSPFEYLPLIRSITTLWMS